MHISPLRFAALSLKRADHDVLEVDIVDDQDVGREMDLYDAIRAKYKIGTQRSLESGVPGGVSWRYEDTLSIVIPFSERASVSSSTPFDEHVVDVITPFSRKTGLARKQMAQVRDLLSRSEALGLQDYLKAAYERILQEREQKLISGWGYRVSQWFRRLFQAQPQQSASQSPSSVS